LQTKKNILLQKVIDISGLDELSLIIEDHSRIVIGSGTSLEDVREYCNTRLPALAGILKVFGSLQIRNIATMGGNVMSASPIGDTLPLLIALGAQVRLLGNHKQREMLLEDFITAYRKTDIQPDEILALVMIPTPGKDAIVKSYKISKRVDLDISTVSACFKLSLSRDNTVKKIDIVYGGMADHPIRVSIIEKYFIGKEWARKTVEEAIGLFESEFRPITDARASAEARMIMAKNLLMKFWFESGEKV
jgi:xanthine dehydrogenase small subunit